MRNFNLKELNIFYPVFLLERASSDWQRFATYASLFEVNCIIENIHQEHNTNQIKMTALLEKLYDINPLQFKELVKSTLITMKRFCVLSAFEEDGCHGKEKMRKETNKEPVLINGSFLNMFYNDQLHIFNLLCHFYFFHSRE